jgi:hypothetical protein
MPRSAEDLTIAAGHVQYELDALVGCYRRFLAAENEAEREPTREKVLIANSYLEAMLVHARCLIEFIWKSRDERERDIHRHDYLPGWDLSDAAEREEARVLYDRINKHLAHLSWERVEATPEEFPGWAYDLPHFVLRLFSGFEAEVRKGRPWATMLEEGVKSARNDLPAAPRRIGGATTSGAYSGPPEITELPPRVDENGD